MVVDAFDERGAVRGPHEAESTLKPMYLVRQAYASAGLASSSTEPAKPPRLRRWRRRVIVRRSPRHLCLLDARAKARRAVVGVRKVARGGLPLVVHAIETRDERGAVTLGVNPVQVFEDFGRPLHARARARVAIAHAGAEAGRLWRTKGFGGRPHRGDVTAGEEALVGDLGVARVDGRKASRVGGVRRLSRRARGSAVRRGGRRRGLGPTRRRARRGGSVRWSPRGTRGEREE